MLTNTWEQRICVLNNKLPPDIRKAARRKFAEICNSEPIDLDSELDAIERAIAGRPDLEVQLLPEILAIRNEMIQAMTKAMTKARVAHLH